MPGSVLENLRAFAWSSQQAVAYEVALEDINEARAVCAARITALEQSPRPDEALVRAWQQQLQRCAAEARALDPEDATAVARVRSQYPVWTARWAGTHD